jgi:hypothetical protein
LAVTGIGIAQQNFFPTLPALTGSEYLPLAFPNSLGPVYTTPGQISNYVASSSTPLAVSKGGTAAATARAASSNLSTGYTICQSGLAVPLTGSVAETTLGTCTIPANTLGANGCVRGSVLWSTTASANAKTMRVRWGGASGPLLLGLASSSTSASSRFDFWLCNANSTSAQISPPSALTGGVGNTSGLVISTALDTTQAQDLVFTGQLADPAETVTLVAYTVQVRATFGN